MFALSSFMLSDTYTRNIPSHICYEHGSTFFLMFNGKVWNHLDLWCLFPRKRRCTSALQTVFPFFQETFVLIYLHFSSFYISCVLTSGTFVILPLAHLALPMCLFPALNALIPWSYFSILNAIMSRLSSMLVNQFSAPSVLSFDVSKLPIPHEYYWVSICLFIIASSHPPNSLKISFGLWIAAWSVWCLVRFFATLGCIPSCSSAHFLPDSSHFMFLPVPPLPPE